MKYTYFILLMIEVNFSIVERAPDINLEGSFLTETDSKLLQLTCSTNVPVQLCNVEILINERTHDSIRYHDYNCYHSKSLCSPKVCMCSYDCMSFTLNVTVTGDIKNQLYSCVSTIENEGVIYSANISVMYDGIGGLKPFKKFIVPHRSASHTQQATTTIFPEIRTFSSLIEAVIITGAVFAFLTFVLLVHLNFKKRYCNSKTETRAKISSISYPITETNTENSADDDRPYIFELKPEAGLDGDQYGFTKEHTQTGEARFSSFDPDTCFEVQQILHSKQQSQSDGDLFGFSEQHSRTGEERFRSVDPDNRLEVQPNMFSKEHSQSDSGISFIPNTRCRHMPLEKDSRTRSIPNTRASQMRLEEDEDMLEFCEEGRRFLSPPRFSYADSGISSISNTRSRQMRLDGVSETSFIVLKNPYTIIPEAIDPRNIGDSTSYTTQFASRSSPPETMPLLDIQSNRLIWENLHIQGSDA